MVARVQGEPRAALRLLPSPRVVRPGSGPDWRLPADSPGGAVLVVGENAASVERAAAGEVARALRGHGLWAEVRDAAMATAPPAPGVPLVLLGTPASSRLLAELPAAGRVRALPPEGYLLTFADVAGRPALFAAGADGRGVLHAAVTAAQLLVRAGPAAGGARWRNVEVEDWPDVPRRGAMALLDYLFPPSLPFRSFEPGILDARDLVDQMVRLKLNTLVVHAADPAWRSQWAASGIELHPGAFRGPDYWQERLQGLVAYARERGLTVLLQLYHTLDGRGRIRVPDCEPCLADPDNQALLEREFARYLGLYPELDGYVFHLSEFRRCACPECGRIPPARELVTMLRRYHDAMARAGQDGKHLGFCLFPARHYSDLRACRDLLPPNACHWAWSDWAAGQVGFFLPFEETGEAPRAQEFPGSWYWLYTNALTDVACPRPAFFQDRARAAATYGLGGVVGQFTFQRGADLNSRALAQYTWHAGRSLDAFLEDAVAAVYGESRLPAKLVMVRRYQAAVEAFLRLLWREGEHEGEHEDERGTGDWKTVPNAALEQTLRTIEAEARAVRAQVPPLLEAATPSERLALRGLLVEAEILALEASARLELRDVYRTWSDGRRRAAGDTPAGASAAGGRALRQLDVLVEQYRTLTAVRADHALVLRASRGRLEALRRLRESLAAALPDTQEAALWRHADYLWRHYYTW